ncbi:MAG: prepilin-type N-terminal cleavage/methylation domain-containing protein [Candidatus Omnitrophota bacterium]
MNRQAFTLAEIIVVIVIVAIIAAVAIPGFTKVVTKADKTQAIAYLRNIRTAEKMYYGKWRTYLTLANSAAILSGLDIETRLPSYAFSVTQSGQTFSVAASGPGGTLTLNESGVWGGTNTPLPPGTD